MRRVLIDECVHPRLADRLRNLLPDDLVETVRGMGWAGYPDRSLIGLIQGRFEVFVTLDQGFEFQHDLRKLNFGIVILRAINNQMPSYERLLGDLCVAVDQVRPARWFKCAIPSLRDDETNPGVVDSIGLWSSGWPARQSFNRLPDLVYQESSSGSAYSVDSKREHLSD